MFCLVSPTCAYQCVKPFHIQRVTAKSALYMSLYYPLIQNEFVNLCFS